MKNLYGLIAASLIIIVIAGFSPDGSDKTVKVSSPLFSANESSKIIAGKKTNSEFQSVNIFTYSSNGNDNSGASQFVSASALLTLSSGERDRLLSEKPENIIFRIPGNNGSVTELELTQSFPSSTDFKIKEKNGITDREVQYTPGLHYSGIIKGKENSIASISIFQDFVMGMTSDENENYVLGSIKNSDNTFSDNYIYYNDRDMKVTNTFKCGVEDIEEKFIKPAIEKAGNSNNMNDGGARLPIRIYFEADNKLYTDFSSNSQQVADFVNGMFNSVKTIYQNEAIPIQVSSIGVWTMADPYRNLNDSYDILLRFGANNQDDFQGNLAHFISSRTAGLGGIAWIRVLCQQYSSQDSAGRFAFSNLEATYNNFPTYSWTINVVTHEMGHNLGSRHTHSCVWPIGGGIRAIDSCYNAEGGCFPTPRARIGTIMSYCHLWTAAQGGGVNLSSGFGPLPGDTIRLRYAQAGCLDQFLNSSEQPSTFDLAQNFPNPFNPSTKINFALPKESNVTLKIFDINGRLVADLISNKFYNAGFFDVTFNTADYDLASGVYYYSLTADGNFVGAKQMVLIR